MKPAPRPVYARVLREALVTFFSNWYNWVPRCALWLLCCLTVVLGPPATFALFLAANYSVHGVFPGVGDLVPETRGYFWLSWLWMLVNLLFGGVIFGCIQIFQALLPAFKSVTNWVIILAVVAWLIVQFYTLPFLLIQERKNLLVGLRNAARAAASAPFYSLVTGGVGLLLAVASLVLIAPLVMGGPALVAVLANQTVLERMKTFKILDDE